MDGPKKGIAVLSSYSALHTALSHPSATLYRIPLFSEGFIAGVAELADAPDLGSGTVTCAGSSPVSGTISLLFYSGNNHSYPIGSASRTRNRRR